METSGQIDTGVYKLSINGASPQRWVERAVQRIVVEDELNVPAMVSIEMALMINVKKSPSRSEDLLFFDDEMFNLFAPGAELTIQMGVDTPEKIFTGVTASISPEFDRTSRLEIIGFDPLYKLMFGRKTRSFSEMSDSDIVSEVAGGVNLKAKADATTTKYPYVFQSNLSDYDFLLERAKRIGYEIGVEDGSLLFRKPLDSGQPVVSLRFDQDLNHFSPVMRTLTEGSDLEFRGWDYRNKTGLSGKAKKGDETVKPKSSGGSSQKSAFAISTALSSSSSLVIDNSILDDSEAETLAKARYNSVIQKFITGEGSCPGNPTIRAGKTIEITGVGSKFSGTYYVTSSRHVWDDGSYTTNFQVRRTVL